MTPLTIQMRIFRAGKFLGTFLIMVRQLIALGNFSSVFMDLKISRVLLCWKFLETAQTQVDRHIRCKMT